MRVRRMTVVLPARLKAGAEHEARLIAAAAAAQLVRGAGAGEGGEAAGGGTIRVEIAGQGLAGHALSGAVARGLPRRGGSAF
ncbi:MAG: hypothetical protein ABW194_02495 [Novosphingobium sp.]